MTAGQTLVFIGLLIAFPAVLVGLQPPPVRDRSLLPFITLIIGVVLIFVGSAIR